MVSESNSMEVNGRIGWNFLDSALRAVASAALFLLSYLGSHLIALQSLWLEIELFIIHLSFPIINAG